MSLYYGFSKYTYETIPVRTLNYQITLSAISKTQHSFPVTLNSGYPYNFLYCYGHKPDAQFTLLSHSFDTDDTIDELSITHKFRAFFKDGTAKFFDLDNIDYKNDISRVLYNTYCLDKSYKFKDIVLNHEDVLMFNIYLQQTAGGDYGNESVLDIAVDY